MQPNLQTELLVDIDLREAVEAQERPRSSPVQPKRQVPRNTTVLVCFVERFGELDEPILNFVCEAYHDV